MNLPGGLHNARYTTLPRPSVRFHDAAILTDTRLFRLCLGRFRVVYVPSSSVVVLGRTLDCCDS